MQAKQAVELVAQVTPAAGRVLVAALLLGVAPPARAADETLPGCTFLPVFAPLRGLIEGQQVGACVADEPPGVDGEVAQRTTTGLLVWRRADDRPAFTDGARTWLLGPGDLVWQRGNDERFDWEPDARAAARILPSGEGVATFPPCLPTIAGWQRSATGITAEVENPCGADEVFGLSATLYDVAGGQPVATTREAVWQAPAGDERAVFLADRTVGGTRATFLSDAAAPPPAQPSLCLDVGTAHCLVTDSWLAGTVEALRGLDSGRALLRPAADDYVSLRWGNAPFDALAFYDFDTRAVTLDARRLATVSDWERAALLAHELQHAVDRAAGRSFAWGAECLTREVDATLVEGQVWRQFWQGRLPVATTAVQEELNALALDVTLGQAWLARTLMPRYMPQCGPVALPPTGRAG